MTSGDRVPADSGLRALAFPLATSPGARAPGRPANLPGVIAAFIAALLRAGFVSAGPPVFPAEYFVQIRGPRGGEQAIEVLGRVQHARPESLDLVRWLPRAAPLPRLETWVSAEGVVLQPRSADPERYRSPMPRGAPLSWGYELRLDMAAELPQVAGSDYWCAWLGGLLLEPHVPEAVDSVVVSRVRLEASSLSGGGEYGPWRREKRAFLPESLADLTDAFLAVGNWRVREQTVGACTLQVALAGTLGVADDAWCERLRREVAPYAPASGRLLVCVAPVAGAPAVHRARRSWLVLRPRSERELPAAPLLPGRHPLGRETPGGVAPPSASADSGAARGHVPPDERRLDR